MSAPAEVMEAASRPKSIDLDPVDLEGDEKSNTTPQYKQDAFGDEEFAEVKYKVLKWWYVFNANTWRASQADTRCV
jgi:hypothetical protein